MPFKLCLVLFLNGFKDSIYGWVKFFQRQKQLENTRNNNNNNNKKTTKTNINEKLYQRLFESCILNGVFLLSCMLAFNFILIPILNWIYFKILSSDKHDFIKNYFNPFLGFFPILLLLLLFLVFKSFT